MGSRRLSRPQDQPPLSSAPVSRSICPNASIPRTTCSIRICSSSPRLPTCGKPPALDSDRLQAILDQYADRLAKWKKRRFRQHIPALAPQITDEEATLLLRISAVQAIYNARAYCRNFDRMTGPQQMAVSQLVYQIGVNLVRFDDFLSLVNEGAPASAQAATSAQDLDAASDTLASDRDYWRSVQHTLMQTQWARLYRTRAIAVIAMLDPAYDESPATAEHLVGASLRPAVLHRHHGHSATLKAASTGKSRPHPRGHRKKARSHNEAS
jgi:hypothetical protein